MKTIYTGRNYTKDVASGDNLRASAVRNGDIAITSIAFSTSSQTISTGLSRDEVRALRNMLNDILADFD